MIQPNEMSAEKIASLEAQIQQKNEERRGNQQQLRTEKQKFRAKHQIQKQQLNAINHGLEMDITKLRTELKEIKIQSRDNHCHRHPRMLAGLRVGCGGADGQGHLLCVGCIRSWSSNRADLGHCSLCKKPIKGGGLDARELKQFIDKLLADEKMLRPDTSLPLPYELSAEIWEFAKKSRFVLYGRNRWGNEAGNFFGELTFFNERLSVSKESSYTSFFSNVRAVKPFCVLKSALIDYCLPDCFYFEVHLKTGYIFIGLSGPDFPLAKGTCIGSLPGSYSLDSSAYYCAGPDVHHRHEKGWYAGIGDVAGCGLLVSPNNDHGHRLFFTKNGRPFGKSILLPAMASNLALLFPTITLNVNTSIVATNFGDDPDRQFRYKFRNAPQNDEEHINPPDKKRARLI